MQITNISIRKYSSGSLRGFADVIFDNGYMELKGFSVFENSDGQWINVPSNQDRNNKTKYFKSVTLCEELMDEVSNAILNAYNDESDSPSDKTRQARLSGDFSTESLGTPPMT